MTIVHFDFQSIIGQSSQGTVYVAASTTRGSFSAPGVVTTSQRMPLPLVDGKATSPNLDPGECVIELESEGVYHRWVINLPTDGEHSLADLEEMTTEYAPAIVTRVMLAEQAVHEARDRTEAAAAKIPEFEQAVKTTTDAATTVEGLTRRAEAAADGSEMSAEDSAAARTASESARDESRSARDVGTSARDEVLQLAAQVLSDRSAAEGAARSAEAAAKREATEAVARLVDGAPEHLDTLAEIAATLADHKDAAGALTQVVSGKAPLQHEHEIGEIRSLPGVLEGKAAAVHTHSISQIESLQAKFDSIADELANRARGNFDFVVATEPPAPGTPLTQVTVITEVPAP